MVIIKTYRVYTVQNGGAYIHACGTSSSLRRARQEAYDILRPTWNPSKVEIYLVDYVDGEEYLEGIASLEIRNGKNVVIWANDSGVYLLNSNGSLGHRIE